MVPASISAERWEQLYRLEFARVYRALLAVLRDPDRALDAIHDAFVAGLRRPPAEDDDLAGWLSSSRCVPADAASGDRCCASTTPDRVSTDEIEALLDR